MPTIPDEVLLDMLGADLGGALLDARTRLADDTIMVRIGGPDPEAPQPGKAHVERGEPAAVIASGMTPAAAVAYLDALS